MYCPPFHLPLAPAAGRQKAAWRVRSIGAILTTLVLLPAVAAAQTVIPLPPQSTTFSTNARGFWFTAPAPFVITGLRVPTDASSGSQTIEVVKFQATPPAYTGSTNTFTSVFRVVSDTSSGVLPVSIPIAQGDIVGVLGVRDDVSSEAPAPAAITVAGSPVRLMRLGMQHPLSTTAARDLWTEAVYGIGRVEVHYQAAKALP